MDQNINKKIAKKRTTARISPEHVEENRNAPLFRPVSFAEKEEHDENRNSPRYAPDIVPEFEMRRSRYFTDYFKDEAEDEDDDDTYLYTLTAPPQYFPELHQRNSLSEAFEDTTTSAAHSYLALDFCQETDQHLRVLAMLLSIVYVAAGASRNDAFVFSIVFHNRLRSELFRVFSMSFANAFPNSSTFSQVFAGT